MCVFFFFIRLVHEMISRSEHGVLKNTDNHDHIFTPNQSVQHILWKHLPQLPHGLMLVQVSGCNCAIVSIWNWREKRFFTNFLNCCQVLLIGCIFHESVSTVAQHLEDLLPNYYCARIFQIIAPIFLSNYCTCILIKLLCLYFCQIIAPAFVQLLSKHVS